VSEATQYPRVRLLTSAATLATAKRLDPTVPIVKHKLRV
jgi:hypothetical protein